MPWQADLPFVSGIGTMDYEVSVTAGPDESSYERTTGNGNKATRYGDNNCPRGGC